MSEPARRPDLQRARGQQLRRTTSARRGVVAVGAVGALGAALAIGVNQVHRTTQPASDTQGGVAQQSGAGIGQQPTPAHRGDAGSGGSADARQRQHRLHKNQPPKGGSQLVAPGTGGPVQGQSGGS